MPHDFYQSKEYREKQAFIMRENWKRGVFNFVYKREKRRCVREGCDRLFEVQVKDPKVYCCHSCAASVSNKERGSWSEEVKLKISKALKGRPSPYKGIEKISRIEILCANPKCKKVFLKKQWEKRKFCSNLCAMTIIGGQPTSHKAAKGKGGVRKDINKSTYFYSRWEANIARLFNLLKIKWIHQPKTFDLGTQNYTPDFYLPDFNLYIEVKNFMWKYSKIRDEKFRKLYPNENLLLILKEDYLKLERDYSQSIKNWEYKNSKVLA